MKKAIQNGLEGLAKIAIGTAMVVSGADAQDTFQTYRQPVSKKKLVAEPIVRKEWRLIPDKQYIINPKEDNNKDSAGHYIDSGRYEVWVEKPDICELVKKVDVKENVFLRAIRDGSNRYEVWSMNKEDDFVKLMDYKINRKTILIRNPTKKLVRVPNPIKEVTEVPADSGWRASRDKEEKPKIHYEIYPGTHFLPEAEKRKFYKEIFDGVENPPQFEDVFPKIQDTNRDFHEKRNLKRIAPKKKSEKPCSGGKSTAKIISF